MEAVDLKLREDLIISHQNGPDGAMSVIKDPVAERFFRFREIEHFIAQQYNGTNSAETIIHRVEERFEVSLSAGNLAQFTRNLQGMGLLVHKDNPVASANGRKKWRLNGDLFYLRGKLFNPESFFNWVYPKIRFMFTPTFLVSSALLVLLAVGITITDWNIILHQSYNLFRIESLILAWFIMLGVVMLHEFAHGLTCKHFGGQVREIGFMLIYFQPAFYCNVSDAWLFPKKAHRMWVTFAGGYFEVFLWALATLVWRLTDPSTTINHFALIVTATSAFKMFFNMNPLIKLDGYYLLCDWLDIPNLRQKAGDYFNNRVKKILGFTSTPYLDIEPRIRNFFIIYSILSVLYIYWILSKIIAWLAGVMVRNYQGWGFTIFCVVIALLFRKQIGNFISPVTSRISTFSGMNRIPNYVKWLLAVVSLLGALFFVRAPLKVAGPFTVLPFHNADIRAEAEGIIEEIYADEGTEVKKGTRIARLSGRDYTADLRKTQADIESREADLRLLQAGAKPEEIEIVKGQITKARELVTLANNQVYRDQILVGKKYISMTEFEDSKERLTIRERELADAQGRLKLLLSGNRKEEMEAVEANIRALQAHEKFTEEQLQLLNILSPIDGVVTTHKLKEKVGQHVNRGDLVAEVYAMKKLRVEIAVPEREIREVTLGQKVVLKARSYPGETFEGKVIH
jgi:putative peptide zinc metalloprotease protein